MLIFTAETMARRSTAIGWCSASSLKQRESISMCSWLIGAVAGEHAIDHRGVALDQRLDRRADAVFGKAAHLEQARLQLLEFFLEMRDDWRSDISRTFPSRNLRSASPPGS